MIPGFIGRTPVYDRSLNLFAYQLLPCSLPETTGVPLEPFLQQIWENVRLDQLTGGKTGLISLPGPLLEGLTELPMPKDKLIVNVPRQLLSDAVLDVIKQLDNQGYVLAISTDCYDETLANKTDYAELWSFDASCSTAELQPHLDELHAKGIKVLLRQIETQQQYDKAFDAGFDYFQGRYFERPRLIHGTQMPANKLTALQLIARLQDPKITIEEVEDLVSCDISLSYKLLRLINAAFYGLPKKVDSIRRAVVFFGLNRIKHWATVVLVNAIDYKPRELMITALVRARTCEYIAEQQGNLNSEECYICGLFSLLDAIMDAPMAEILKHMSLTDDINEALVFGGGPLGPVLQTTLSLEQGVCQRLPLETLNLEDTMRAFVGAIEWAEQVRLQLQQEPPPE